MMFWIPYGALAINILVIWLMPKHLTKVEIYVSWAVIALINLSSDVVLSLYFKLYELNGSGVQLTVHFIELTLGSSYGIIFLNFMPKKMLKFLPYLAIWLVYSIIFELILVHVKFINYSEWKIEYSFIYYLFALLFTRWHLHFIRKERQRKMA